MYRRLCNIVFFSFEEIFWRNNSGRFSIPAIVTSGCYSVPLLRSTPRVDHVVDDAGASYGSSSWPKTSSISHT